MSATYQSIIRHYERCLAEHGDTYRGVDWPNPVDAAKRYEVMLDLIRQPAEGTTLLDFGCGASHLYEYMLQRGFDEIRYGGLDASPAFCALASKKFPQNTYQCVDVLKHPEQVGEYDYVVMNGVFTEKRELSFDAMFGYMQQVLLAVFPKVRRGLAFNVMSKQVDWERDDLFHMPMDTLAAFLLKHLTRHFVVRNDYGLYEYTVYVYKEHN